MVKAERLLSKSLLQRENIMVLNGAFDQEELALLPANTNAADGSELQDIHGGLPEYVLSSYSDMDDDIDDDDDYEDDIDDDEEDEDDDDFDEDDDDYDEDDDDYDEDDDDDYDEDDDDDDWDDEE